jgi:multiple antibiotic resistance protein
VDFWTDHTRFASGLLALVDPFTSIPLFLAVTAHLSPKGKTKASIVAAITATGILLLFQATGESIIEALGSSLPSFQIAGGLVISLAGLQMLSSTPGGNLDLADDAKSQSPIHVGIVPLGVPMLGGAGAITKVVAETHQGFGIEHEVAITAIIVAVGMIVAAVLAVAAPIGRVLGPGGLTIINRLAGIIVLAIAVEMIITGYSSHPSLS